MRENLRASRSSRARLLSFESLLANRITLPINFERAGMWTDPSKMVGELFGSFIYYLYLYNEFKNKSYEWETFD